MLGVKDTKLLPYAIIKGRNFIETVALLSIRVSFFPGIVERHHLVCFLSATKDVDAWLAFPARHKTTFVKLHFSVRNISTITLTSISLL